jgi:hypothetical protein
VTKAFWRYVFLADSRGVREWLPFRAATAVAMAMNKDAYRQFQEELAALDKAQETRRKETTEAPMERARREFLALRERYHLSVADVVAFFPEEEGIAYLQGLIAASAEKPVRKRRVSRKAEQED